VDRVKRINRFIIILLASVLVLANARLLDSCSATTRLPGVAPGQFLHYSMNITVTGNDTELMIHAPQSQSGWGNVTVLSVLNTNVTFQTVFYNVTTNQSAAITQNIETGVSNSSSAVSMLLIAFIAANLSAGDPVYLDLYGESPLINGTVIADYLDQPLETNYLAVSHNETNVYLYDYVVNSTLTGQVYWERKTGIMLDYHIEQDVTRSDGAGGVLTAHMMLRELILTAAPPPPAVPELSPPSFLTLFIAVTLLAVILYKRRAHSMQI
jgi:hypothetical protein